MIAVFWLEVAVLLWAASFGGGFQGQVTQLLGVNDKIMHVLAFAVLAITGLVLWRVLRIVVPALLGFALAVEALQGFVPGRTPSLGDFIASAAGIVIATIVWRAGVAFWPLLRNKSDAS